MFHLEALAERVPLTPIFQNMTLIYHVQRLANVNKIAKFNLPSIYIYIYMRVLYAWCTLIYVAVGLCAL